MITGTIKGKFKHGFGVYHYSNGDIYEGNWFEDEQNGIILVYVGQGTYKFCNGSVYHGNFKNGQPHGEGTLDYIVS